MLPYLPVVRKLDSLPTLSNTLSPRQHRWNSKSFLPEISSLYSFTMNIISALKLCPLLCLLIPGILARDVDINPKFENNIFTGGTCTFTEPKTRKEYSLTLANFVETKRPGMTPKTSLLSSACAAQKWVASNNEKSRRQ
jgi:hypothetical protein